MDTDLAGRTAVVPGSTAGLGLAIARALAAEGANVVIAGRRGDRARAEAARLPAAIGVEVDLTEPSGPATLIGAANDRFGAIDVLILNGGGPAPSLASALDDETITQAVEQLIVQHQRFVCTVLPTMRTRKWGRLIAIGSSGVQQPIERMALSNIGRAGLAAYLKTLAAEVAPDGVTVNMVLPGRIDTDRVAALDQAKAELDGLTITEVRSRSEANIPAGRYGTTKEFAAVVTFLASASASYVTGEQIRCDGGMVKNY